MSRQRFHEFIIHFYMQLCQVQLYRHAGTCLTQYHTSHGHSSSHIICDDHSFLQLTKTFSSATFSSLSCLVISWIAILSSVWSRPFRRTWSRLVETLRFFTSSARTCFSSCKARSVIKLKPYYLESLTFALVTKILTSDIFSVSASAFIGSYSYDIISHHYGLQIHSEFSYQ